MSIQVTPAALNVAMQAWLDSLRREWSSAYPDNPNCPVPEIKDMRPEVKVMFLRSIHVAIKATDPKNVQRVLIEQGE